MIFQNVWRNRILFIHLRKIIVNKTLTDKKGLSFIFQKVNKVQNIYKTYYNIMTNIIFQILLYQKHILNKITENKKKYVYNL